MILRVETPAGCLAEWAYVLRVLLGEFLGLQYEHVVTDGGEVRITRLDGRSGVLRCPDVFLRHASGAWLDPSTLPKEPLARCDTPLALRSVNDQPLIVLYGNADCAKWSGSVAPGDVALNVDVFGGAFFALTRYEEVAGAQTGQHGWFPAAAALAVRERYLDRPIVNEYVELLWTGLRHLWPELRRKSREYRVLVTHDVDWPSCNVGRGIAGMVKTLAGDVLVRRDAGVLAKRALSAAGVLRGNRDCDVCNTFDFVMTESERRGLRSAFYFITGHSAGFIDGLYEIGDPWVRRLLRSIHARGHEIGIHPSYNTLLDANRTRAEYEALRQVCREEGIEQPVWGGRQHYLRWRAGETWRHWDEAGLGYDSTVGHAERLGFRSGTCYEYPAYDVLRRRPLCVRERPLVAMEVSALDIMRLSFDETRDEMIRLSRVCRRYAGDFTLLWHNNRIVTRAERQTYLDVLDGAVAA